MRRVTDPSGVAWVVDVEWTGRRQGFWQRYRARKRRKRKGLGDQLDDLGDGPAHLFDVFDVFDDGLAVIGALLALIAFVVAAIVFGPWIFVLLLDLLEILIFPILAGLIIAWRVLRKRPFALRAERMGVEVARWNVVGVLAARELEHSIAESVVAGGDVTTLYPEHAC